MVTIAIEGGADFWTVRNPDRAIVIQCRDGAAYDEIFVEVEDPVGTVGIIKGAIGRPSSSSI